MSVKLILGTSKERTFHGSDVDEAPRLSDCLFIPSAHTHALSTETLEKWCMVSITPSSPGDKPRNATRGCSLSAAVLQEQGSSTINHLTWHMWGSIPQHCSATPQNCKNWHLGRKADAAGFWLQAHQFISHTHHWAIYRSKWTFPSPINPQMSIQPTLNTDWFSTLTSTVSHLC